MNIYGDTGIEPEDAQAVERIIRDLCTEAGIDHADYVANGDAPSTFCNPHGLVTGDVSAILAARKAFGLPAIV